MDREEVIKLQNRIALLEKELKHSRDELNQKSRLLQIETALEKVSARTIAMRSSNELADTSSILFHQLKELGIHALRTGVGIFDEPNDAMELWLTTASDSDEVVKMLDYVNLHIHPVFENIIPARKEGKPYAVSVLSGKEVKAYYSTMSTYLTIPQQPVRHEQEFFYSFFFSQGALNVNAAKALTEEECRIMIQFARVFGLIYMRFLDLQLAEKQTQEALQQASLDRVQAEIASMRTANDLQRITPLIWKELSTLGVPFFRCGIFIVSEKDKLVHAYMSTPEGTSLAVLHLPFESIVTIRNMVENWRQQQVYTEQWDRQQFQDWVQSLYDQGQIKGKQEFQVNELPPEAMSLHYIPFAQGMLYIGSYYPLDEHHIDLVVSLTDSLSVAYARYEDFIKLEESKAQVEATLNELKETQSQLIQSEKMASLGELTAGIAHEIQNPLNFVNNFSEVNKELLQELNEEVEKGNFEEVKSLAKDVSENQEKITFHGKRADGIVKSMLQHSRTSSGQKEFVDINLLCDEYLRLAYHGLRAKDKSFNAKFETYFEESLPKINVVPQDLGRVILNLINNAFYAVNERLRQAQPDSSYEPLVVVSTKKLGDKIEISVKDNGNGIPDTIKEKIFQPFFTTKPTGQGTGLGLSLSYDIVKAHGGELQVSSFIDSGTEFIIVIP
jgi:signal transduction histidine kinase